MSASRHVQIRIDLSRLRANVQAIRARTGVEVWPVIKADAYGLGVERVAEALRDIADGFCVFSLREAVDAELFARAGKPIITIGPPGSLDAKDYIDAHVRPAVSTPSDAGALRAARPILAVDTGMQRFACPENHVDGALRAGDIEEAFTHATTLKHVELLRRATANHRLKLHAAATALLDEPAAWLDAVRPGLACYRGAVRVTAPLHEVRTSAGPIGYTGFVTSTGRHGVILAGYSHGLRAGPCMVNGVQRQIVEVGMQSSYVELGEHDRAGDGVVLLGDELTEADLAAAWQIGEHQALLLATRCGQRTYVS